MAIRLITRQAYVFTAEEINVAMAHRNLSYIEKSRVSIIEGAAVGRRFMDTRSLLLKVGCLPSSESHLDSNLVISNAQVHA